MPRTQLRWSQLKSLRSHLQGFELWRNNACSTYAVPPERQLDLRSSARRDLLGLCHAFSRCAEAIANEATTFCKQLYIAACNHVFSNPASLTAADQRCIDTAWDLADAVTNAARRAAKRTADSLHLDLPQDPWHQRTRLSSANISSDDYDVCSQDT